MAPAGEKNKFGLTAEQMAMKRGFRSCAVLIQAFELAPKKSSDDVEAVPKSNAKKDTASKQSTWNALERDLAEEEDPGEDARKRDILAMMKPRFQDPEELEDPSTKKGDFDYRKWDRI